MRRAKRSLGGQPAAASDQSGDRVDRRDLQRLLEHERGENTRDAPRHHRLARAWRTDHQGVMPPGCGNLQRATRERLTVHVSEVAIMPLSGWGRRAIRV